MLHQWDRDEVAVQGMEDTQAGDVDMHNPATSGASISTSTYYEVTCVKTDSCLLVICL